jgi:polar amino acid transport system permease protein
MAEILDTFLNVDIIKNVSPLLLQGLWMTLSLAAVAIPCAFLTGLAIASWLDGAGGLTRRMLIEFIDLFRSFPPLVLLIFLFYALPLAGVNLTAFWAAILAFTLNGSSYFAEIFRAGLQAVPKGQREAARSSGLGAGQTLVYVVIPQAIRKVLPDLLSNTIELFKGTSIAAAVSMQELLRMAQIAQDLTFNPSPLIAAAIIYIAIAWPVVRTISILQRRRIPA